MIFSYIKSALRTILPEKIKKKVRKLLTCYSRFNVKLIFYLLNSFPLLKSLTNLLTNRWIELRYFDNIGNCAFTHPQDIEYIFNVPNPLYYSPPKFDGMNVEDSNLIEVNGYKKYAAVFKTVYVIGGSNLILLGKKKALYDLYYDTQKKFWYTDGGIQYYKNDCCLVKINNSKITFDEAIFLAGNFSWNYYHLLFEILVKFEQIDALNLDLSVPILVDKICLEIPQYLELFTLLDSKGRKLIALDRGKRYKVKRLYYFSCPNIIPPNYLKNATMNAEDALFNLSALQYLRSNLLRVANKPSFPKRLFISRAKATGGRKYNEHDVFDVLKKYGFITVYPENYTIADQIAMFNNAEFIAGGTGAAFSNLLFCQKNCKVIIFTNYKLPLSIFSTIATYVGVDMVYLNDDCKRIDDMKNIHDSFTINIDRLNEIVSGWIA